MDNESLAAYDREETYGSALASRCASVNAYVILFSREGSAEWTWKIKTK